MAEFSRKRREELASADRQALLVIEQLRHANHSLEREVAYLRACLRIPWPLRVMSYGRWKMKALLDEFNGRR